MTRLTLIVAATLANGIGQSSRLPWRLPQEMAYFAKVTSNAPEDSMNAVVMGRKTWESIPTKFRPLKGRQNLVVSRNQGYELLPAEATTSLHPALESALKHLAGHDTNDAKTHRVFVIGGATLYNETLKLPPSSPAFVDRVLLTRIVSPSFDECDVFFPDFVNMAGDGRAWTRSTHAELNEWVGFEVPEGLQEEKGVQYEFQMWMR